MTDEERQRFSRRLREATAEVERLRAVLQTIADQNSEHWAKGLARRALEPKP